MQTWEGAYARPWDALEEDEEGGLQSTVEKLLARGRRKRWVEPRRVGGGVLMTEPWLPRRL